MAGTSTIRREKKREISGLDKVWVSDGAGGFLLGKIVELSEDGPIVQPFDQSVKCVTAGYESVYPAEEDDRKEVDDNCSLMYLNEATLLNNVMLRYSKDKIYTYVANILIAVIGNVQEKTIRQYNASNSEVVLYSYAIGFVYLFFLVAVFTDIASAIHYCSYYPKQTYGYAFIFSLTGYLGIQIVLGLVRQFGAFLAVAVTTFRKTLSIFLSFIFFSKPFTIHYP